jgi:uncharacterized repeat protein (TIGR01451 family)
MSNTIARARRLAAVLLLLILAQPASAAVYTAGDAAALIAAIKDANATPAVDVIELTGDVVLSAVDNTGNGANGLPAIVTPIVVIGNGHWISRDSGAPPFRLFEVLGGFFGAGELTLDGLTLAGGDASPGAAGPPASPCLTDLSVCGGAALVISGDLTLRNGARVEDNQAYQGGGVYNAFGRLTIEDGTLTGNRAELGGAIASLRFDGVLAVTIARSTFSGNQAVGGSGGAIYNRSTMTVVDSTFEGNRVTNAAFAFQGGGAIDNNSFAGQADIANSLFTNNEAPRGGAILNFNAADLTLRNSDVVANRLGPVFGDAGGGIWNGGSGAAVILKDSRVKDNEGASRGGGIYSDEGGLVTLESSEVSGNAATFDGGGAVILAGRVVNSRIENNTGGGEGGGIYHEGLRALEIVASSISNNTARREGGGLATFSPFAIVPDGITIDDSTISGNTAETGGGVANTERGVITIRRSLIANNAAAGPLGGFGGGISSNSSGQTTIVDSTIANNTATSTGGGVHNNNFSVLTLEHSTVTNNSSGNVGGGVLAVAPVFVADSIIAHNAGGGGSPNCADFSSMVDNGGNYTDDLGTSFPCQATFAVTPALNLGPLADNGGPTLTIAPGAGSPALGGGAKCQTPTDQRGVPRQILCSSGAYELDVAVPLLGFELAASTVDESPGGPHQVFLELDNTAGTLADGRVEAYLVIDGLAAPGGRDYETTVGPPIIFGNGNWPAPGASARQAVELDVLPDFLLEGDETVRLALRTGGFAGPASLGAGTEHVVTIRDALADLQVDKRVDATGTVYPGTPVTYTIEVTNNGPTDAANVSVYDVLDATALDLAGATVATSTGVFDPATGDWSQDGALQGNGFALPAGAMETLTVTAEVTGAAAETVFNTAELSRYFPPLAADPDPANDSATVSFDVCDATPPQLSVELTPNVLWPPNHMLVKVTATVTASDDSGLEPSVSLVSVTSNEPDNGLGDGDTANDIVIKDDTTLKLRAERSGLGDGRIYTVTYEAVDACGNATQASATVTVPKSQGGDEGS